MMDKMKEDLSVRFLYHTIPGRLILKLLVHPWISKVAGSFLDSRVSVCFIPHFREKNKIELKGIEVPQGGFPSFNAFFSRKKLSFTIKRQKGELISPCDGFLSCLPIRKDSVFDIKHTQFSMNDLLQDEDLAKEYEDGLALVFRLTPAHYHRYCYAIDGQVVKNRRIEGKLHCVRPIATRTYPVYAQNSREYQVIQTEEFGSVVQMEIGALLVGRITNHACFAKGSRVNAGEEKGYFEFGGSTILLLFQKDTLSLREELMLQQTEEGEVPVRQGEVVGYVRQ